MLEEVRQLESTAVAEIQAATDEKAIAELRVRLLGRKSPLRQTMGQIGKLPADQRPALGQVAGQAQRAIQAAFEARETELRREADASSALDVTHPGRRPLSGSAHPLTRLTDELTTIFEGMGFDIADGPDAEDEYHNFDA